MLFATLAPLQRGGRPFPGKVGTPHWVMREGDVVQRSSRLQPEARHTPVAWALAERRQRPIRNTRARRSKTVCGALRSLERLSGLSPDGPLLAGSSRI